MKLTRGQIITHILSLAPLLLLIYGFFQGRLTANPIQAVTLRTGRTALNLLIFSLTCTPIRNIFQLSSFIPIRKTLGLYAFLYALLHFLTFIGLDFEFNWKWIVDEIQFIPFIQLGLLALILLTPLAVTSLGYLKRKMGKWWGILHKIVYITVILIIIHFFQASKGDIGLPFVYGGVFIGLMLLRLPPLNRISIENTPEWLLKMNQFLIN